MEQLTGCYIKNQDGVRNMRHFQSKPAEQSGFTIVELMIATLVFSTILVVITSGVIHFTAAYYKGVHTSSTQTTARTVMNTIARNLQYGGGKSTLVQISPTDTSADKYICVGDVQIDYKLGAQLGTTDTEYGVFVTTVDSSGVCKPYSAGLKGRELLAPKMRLTNLSVDQQILGAKNLYDVSVGVAFGDLDLLCARTISPSTAAGGCAPNAASFTDYAAFAANGASVGCKGGSGSQFCAYSQLTSQVAARFESAGN